MRNKTLITLLAVLLLVTRLGGVVGGGGESPYELKNYTALPLDDARKCSFSHDRELIVFVSIAEKPDMSSIWVANADGTERRLVFRNSSIEDTFTYPKFSPDGEKIVFTTKEYDSEQKDIYEYQSFKEE